MSNFLCLRPPEKRCEIKKVIQEDFLTFASPNLPALKQIPSIFIGRFTHQKGDNYASG
jgi:hypothetical protein